MPKIKLTKNEQKIQKDALKRFNRYLPTLQLKKQQLQIEVWRIRNAIAKIQGTRDQLNMEIAHWISLFGEEPPTDQFLIKIKELKESSQNIAGIEIPVFEDVRWESLQYDLSTTPLWVDKATVKIQTVMKLELEMYTLERQIELLNKEFQTTSQRVNLFEKVKIPETKSNIKRIAVYLGDQQTAAVVRGKIAKKNLG